MYNNMKGRLSPIHTPDIVRGRGRPRPATVGLPVDEVHIYFSRLRFDLLQIVSFGEDLINAFGSIG